MFVDCKISSVRIFAEPGCESAHIATFERINGNIAVAMLGYASFTDLLQTSCGQSIPNIMGLESIAGTVTPTISSNIRLSTHEHQILRRENLHSDMYRHVNTLHMEIPSPNLAKYDPSHLTDGLLRRSSVEFHSLPVGCSVDYMSSIVYHDDDDPTSQAESYPLSVHCSRANLT